MPRYRLLVLVALCCTNLAAGDNISQHAKHDPTLLRRRLEDPGPAAVDATVDAAVDALPPAGGTEVVAADDKPPETPPETPSETSPPEQVDAGGAAETQPPGIEAATDPPEGNDPVNPESPADGGTPADGGDTPADGGAPGDSGGGTPGDGGAPADNGGPPPDNNGGQSNACASASTCDHCKTASEEAKSTTNGYKCAWRINDANGGAFGCELIPASEAVAGDECSQHSQHPSSDAQTEKTEEPWDEEGDGSAFTMGVVLLAVVLVGAAAIRFKLCSRGGGSSGGDDGKSVMSDFGSIMGSSRVGGKGKKSSKYSQSETVPLAGATAADDDEEWGWEDSSAGGEGDIEMSSKKDDEDLTMAFAMTRPKASPSVTRPTIRTPPTSFSPKAPVAYSPTPAATSTMPMQITSLGIKKTSTVAAKKKPVKKKTPDDDLFASMGFSAKPTFQHAPPKPAAAAPVSNTSSLAAVDMGGDADWDDDGDLDDLLND